jgi:hypothetical protein
MLAGDCPNCVDPDRPPVEGGEVQRRAESGVVSRSSVLLVSESSDVLWPELISTPRPARSSRGDDRAPL